MRNCKPYARFHESESPFFSFSEFYASDFSEFTRASVSSRVSVCVCVAFLKVVSRQTARRGQSTRTKKNQEGSNAEGEAGVSSPLKKSVETASSEYTVTAPTGNVVGNSCSTEPARQRTTGKESSPDRTQRQSENERRLLSDFSEQALERELARRRQLRDPTAPGGVGGGILDVDVNDDNADRFSVVEKGSACGEEKGAVCVPCFEIA